MSRKLLAAIAFAPVVAANSCPGSKSWIHASCQVDVTAQASCKDVIFEMEARVLGVSKGKWHDPHNNGTYTITGDADGLNLQRVTGNKKYTDKIKFTFAQVSDGTCQIQGCSESQSFSIGDFSTNYCNMRMLYCGSADGCKPVARDFSSTETQVSPSFGASKNPSDCLKTSSAREFLVAQSKPSQCPPSGFDSTQDFDLESFISKRWYVQQQMEVKYLPKYRNRCVYAEYKLEEKKTFWGYDVAVHNYAEEVEPPHAPYDSGSKLCAKIVDKTKGQLKVAPCFLPSFLAGPYWVLAYDEEAGYALISGGPPKIATDAGCTTSSGTNDSGLWVFTRSQKRDDALVQKVRGIAKEKGFDLSVLNDVDQLECDSETAQQIVM